MGGYGRLWEAWEATPQTVFILLLLQYTLGGGRNLLSIIFLVRNGREE